MIGPRQVPDADERFVPVRRGNAQKPQRRKKPQMSEALQTATPELVFLPGADRLRLITEMRRAGRSLREIADEFGVTTQRVHQILTRPRSTRQPCERQQRHWKPASYNGKTYPSRRALARDLGPIIGRPFDTCVAWLRRFGDDPEQVRAHAEATERGGY
jgi:hypothetical protein